MARIPYDIVAIEANKIIKRFYVAKDLCEASNIYREYEQFLGACGWTDTEFDQATMKRVDESWDESTAKPPAPPKYLN